MRVLGGAGGDWFWNNTLVLALFLGLFVAVYIRLYWRIVRFKAPRWLVFRR